MILAIPAVLLLLTAPWLARCAVMADQDADEMQSGRDSHVPEARAFVWGYRLVGLLVLGIAAVEALWPLASG